MQVYTDFAACLPVTLEGARVRLVLYQLHDVHSVLSCCKTELDRVPFERYWCLFPEPDIRVESESVFCNPSLVSPSGSNEGFSKCSKSMGFCPQVVELLPAMLKSLSDALHESPLG